MALAGQLGDEPLLQLGAHPRALVQRRALADQQAVQPARLLLVRQLRLQHGRAVRGRLGLAHRDPRLRAQPVEQRRRVAADPQPPERPLQQHVLDASLLQDAAVVQQRDPVAQRLDVLHQMRVEENRLALALELMQQLPHLAAPDRVHRRGRLVQEQDARIGDKRAGEAEPLLHAFGVAFDPVARAQADADPLQQLRHAPIRLLAAESGQLGVQPHDLVSGEPLLVAVQLRQVADEPPRLDRARLLSKQRSPTFRREDQADEHLDAGALARAVRAEEAKGFPFPHRNRDVAAAAPVRVPLGQRLGLDREGIHAPTSSSSCLANQACACSRVIGPSSTF